MTILPYKLKTTNDQLTSRAGLLAVAQLLEKLELSKRIDSVFPLPKSNRGINPSLYIQTLIMMQHEGCFHLDDVRHLESDTALKTILGIKTYPKPTSIGDWLRKTGKHQATSLSLQKINKTLLAAALHTNNWGQCNVYLKLAKSIAYMKIRLLSLLKYTPIFRPFLAKKLKNSQFHQKQAKLIKST